MDFVFDASTLILLAKVALLRDVTDIFQIAISEGVERECLVKDCFDAVLIKQLIQEKRIEVKIQKDEKGINKIMQDFRIGVGEAEAIWLAKSLDLPLAVDDGQAIKTSRAIGLQFATAIHFLLYMVSAHQLQIPIALEKLVELSRVGRYSKRIIEDAEKKIKGEIP